MIVIIDYRAGNLASIRNMLKRLGHESLVSNRVEDINAAKKLILPGVGHFDHGMRHIHELGLINILRERVLEQKTPILGICLGAQLMTQRSDEGEMAGLGWFDAETIAFDKSQMGNRLRIPHMGWAEVEFSKKSSLFAEMKQDARFYFVHKYHMVSRSDDDILVTARHGYKFVAGIQRDNIAGVQFHPEKSHKFGLCLLDNFVRRF